MAVPVEQAVERAIERVPGVAGGPLDQGRIRDGRVQCPWHDSVFALRDGGIVHGPATQPQASFETRVREGRVEIRLAPQGKANG